MPPAAGYHLQSRLAYHIQNIPIPPAAPDLIALGSVLIQNVIQEGPCGAAMLKQEELAIFLYHLNACAHPLLNAASALHSDTYQSQMYDHLEQQVCGSSGK
jgi:hypothetical protein